MGRAKSGTRDTPAIQGHRGDRAIAFDEEGLAHRSAVEQIHQTQRDDGHVSDQHQDGEKHRDERDVRAGNVSDALLRDRAGEQEDARHRRRLLADGEVERHDHAEMDWIDPRRGHRRYHDRNHQDNGGRSNAWLGIAIKAR